MRNILFSIMAWALFSVGVLANTLEDVYKWEPIHSCDELISGTLVMLAMEDYAGTCYVLTANSSLIYTWEQVPSGKNVEDLPAESHHNTLYSQNDSLWQFVTKMKPYSGYYYGQTYTTMAPTTNNYSQWSSGQTVYSGLWGVSDVNSAGAKAWQIESLDIHGHFFLRSTTDVMIATPANYFLSYDPNKQYLVSRKSFTAVNQWETHQTIAEITHDNNRAAAITIYAYLKQYDATFVLGEHASWNDAARTPKVLSGASLDFPIPITDHGWVFTGWNTESDGSGVMVTDLANFITLSSDTTLYAQYRPNFAEDIIVREWNTESIVIQTAQAVETATTQVIANATAATIQYGKPLSIQTHQLVDCTLPGDKSIYTLTFNAEEVAKHPGEVLNIVFYDGNENEVGTASLTIPIIVKEEKNLSSFSQTLTDVCDIYVDNKAILTINVDRSLQHIHVLGGGKLVVPTPQNLSAISLRLQGGDIRNGQYYFRYPQLVANGRIYLESDAIMYDYLLNAQQYYALTLPYDVPFSAITYQDGTPAKRYAAGVKDYDYDIQYYDGEKRTTGATGWKTVPPSETTIQAGKGYVICAFPPIFKMNGGGKVMTKYGVLRFPLNADFTMHGEQQKIVPVTTPGFDGTSPKTGVKVNDAGWNLVGNPYLATLTSEQGLANPTISLLVEDEQGEYSWVGNNRYVVIPSNDGHAYSQILAKNASLPAFKNFFVQIGQGDALQFNLSNRAQRVPERDENEEPNEWSIGLCISQNGQEDRMGVLVGDNFTADYELNADLAKWMNNDLNLYAQSHCGKLAYIALPRTMTNAIPLSITTASKADLTIQLDSLYDYSCFAAIYLQDVLTNQTVDLLQQDYQFSSSTNIVDSRLFLSLILKQPAITTEVTPLSDVQSATYFDILGRPINAMETHGVYILRMGTQTQKVAW